MWKRFKAWLTRRKYTTEMQLEALRTTLFLDARWMAHNPIAAALTTRYRALLGEDWHKVRVEGVESLRRRLGLDPHVIGAVTEAAKREVRALSAETARAAHIALTHSLSVVDNEIVKERINEALREIEEKHPETKDAEGHG